MKTRLSLILLMTVLSFITLASVPDTVSVFTTLARPYAVGELPPKHLGTSVPPPHRKNFVSGPWTSDKSAQWGVHLALELVRRPKLNEKQVRIILDAISVASSQVFTVSKSAADLQALRRRALATFSKSEVADLFAGGGKADQDILKLYYDLSVLPLKQRKAAFRRASSNDQSDLWRTHLALFLIKRPDMNERQQQVILTAIALATPEQFEIPSTSPDWKTKVGEPLRSLETQILVAFSFEDGAKIFATLGDGTETAKGWTLGGTLLNTVRYEQFNDHGPYKQRSPNRFAGQDMYVERNSCSCSTNSDWCPISGYCSYNGSCTPTQSGCGTFWRWPCNGGCQ